MFPKCLCSNMVQSYTQGISHTLSLKKCTLFSPGPTWGTKINKKGSALVNNKKGSGSGIKLDISGLDINGSQSIYYISTPTCTSHLYS